MKNERTQTRITGLAALLVFTVFAVCTLLVLLLGANVYRYLTRQGQLRYDGTTAAQYVATRVHQADRAESVFTENFCGVQALVLRQVTDGQAYETRVYCYDGHLCELFAAADSGLVPEDGEKILPLQDLSFHLDGQLLTVTITDTHGTEQVLTLLLRAGKAVAS